MACVGFRGCEMGRQEAQDSGLLGDSSSLWGCMWDRGMGVSVQHSGSKCK